MAVLTAVLSVVGAGLAEPLVGLFADEPEKIMALLD